MPSNGKKHRSHRAHTAGGSTSIDERADKVIGNGRELINHMAQGTRDWAATAADQFASLSSDCPLLSRRSSHSKQGRLGIPDLPRATLLLSHSSSGTSSATAC